MTTHDELSPEDVLLFALAMALAKARTRKEAAEVVRVFRVAVRESVADAYTRHQLRAAARLAALFWKQYRQRLQ